MDTTGKNGKSGSNRKAVIIAALSLFTIGGGTAILFSGKSDQVKVVNDGKLENERLLAEKLQLEKKVMELGQRYDLQGQELNGSQSEAAQLRQRVADAIARSKGLEGAARKSKDLNKQVAELRELKQQLEGKLAATADRERDLQAKLDKMTADRNALASKLDERAAGAEMVNNAEVDALRGKKSKLTVVARQAKEIRMAFDLPQNLASNAQFKIITPDGRNYTGKDPAISMNFDTEEAEPMASLEPIPLSPAGERAARVHLKFKPKEKLKPGAYRIDVMSGDVYLNTVLLNLR